MPKVATFLFDPNVGGPTVRVRQVNARLQQAGWETVVVIPAGDGSAQRYLEDAGLRVLRPAVAKPSPPSQRAAFAKFAVTAPLGLWRLWRLLRREAPDVIHVNGAFDILPALAGRLAGIPVVWHLNDTIFGAGISRILGGVVRRLASRIVVAAARVGQHYYIPRARQHIICAPVDTNAFPARDNAAFPRRPARLLLVGNWNWVKSQDRFLDMIEVMLKDGADIRATIAGGFIERQRGFWEPLVARMADTPDLAARIDAPGFVDNVTALLQEADILVMTSQSEASPIVVLEAMSIGVPVVSFDVGGVADMIGAHGDAPAGVILDNGDINGMARACTDLLADPVRYRRIAAAGQDRARAEYDLPICVDRHIAAYAAAMGTTGERLE